MNSNSKQFVMLHDEKRCIGCQACTVACKIFLKDTADYKYKFKALIMMRQEIHITNFSEFPVNIVKMRLAFLSALQVLHLLMKMALYRLKKSSVLAVITVLVLVLITFDISIH